MKRKRVGHGAGGKASRVKVKAHRRVAPEAASITIEVIDNDGNPDPNPRVKPQDVVRIKATVADSSGATIGNHRLQFKVEARDVDVEIARADSKVIALTLDQRNNLEDARKAIKQAYIDTNPKAVKTADSVSEKFMPIGRLTPRKARTASNGTVFVRYRAPRIGGNQEQPAVDVVKVTSAAKPELTAECRIELSCNLVEVTAHKGFKIEGSFGRYATKDVRDNLIQAGETWFNEVLAARQNAPNSKKYLADQTIPEEFTITALNLRHGGVYPPHVTHRDGLNVDVRPINAGGKGGRWKIEVKKKPKGKKKWRINPNYKRAATSELVNIFLQNGAKKIFFNDSKIENVESLAGHDDHLHVGF